jgi:ferredoxin
MGGQMLEFRPEKDNDSFESTVVSAEIGAELSEVAEAAEIPIAYKCRKGECGTCEVNLNGKWVRTCQTQVPAMSKDEDLVVIVKKIKKKPAKFFSPKSFAEGVFNNGLGVAGFVWRGARSGKEFRSRMEREQEIEALVEKRRSEKADSNM